MAGQRARNEFRHANALAYAPALFLALLAVAFFIDRRSIWLDEANSWSFSSLPLGDMFFGPMRRQDSVFLVYYTALHFWQTLGQSAIVLRSFSALFALASIPLVFAIAKRLFDKTHAMVATLLLAVNASYVYYATEARPYAAVFFFAALGTYLFLRVCDGEIRLAPWYAAAVAAAAYMHALAVFLPMSHAMSLIVLRPPGRTAATLARWYAALAAALVPLALLAHRNGTQQIAWIPATSPGAIRLFVENLAGTAPLALVLALLVIAAVWMGRAGSRRSISALLAWSLTPIALGVLLSLHQHVFIARYFLYTLIPITILAAHGVLSLRNAIARTLAVIVTLAAIGHGLWYLSGFQVEDWRGAVAYIHRQALPGDGRLVYVPYQSVPYRYAFLELTGREDVAILYPGDLRFTDFNRASPLPARVLRSFSHRRVWVVFCRAGRIERTPVRAIYRYAHLVSIRRFKGVDVMLFAPGHGPKA